MEILAQIFGWIGAFLVIIAYFLISYKKVGGTNKIYQLMNLAGALRSRYQCFLSTGMATACHTSRVGCNSNSHSCKKTKISNLII